MAAFVTGTASSDPPRFPGEDLVAALLAASLLAALAVFVRRADSAERTTTLGFLFVASFAALDVLCALYLFMPRPTLCFLPQEVVAPAEVSMRSHQTLAALQELLPAECRPASPPTVSPLFWTAMAPAVLVAALLCVAAFRHSAGLRLVGFGAGTLFALAGLLLSLARALS